MSFAFPNAGGAVEDTQGSCKMKGGFRRNVNGRSYPRPWRKGCFACMVLALSLPSQLFPRAIRAIRELCPIEAPTFPRGTSAQMVQKTCTREGIIALFTDPPVVISPYASPPSLKPQRLCPAPVSAPLTSNSRGCPARQPSNSSAPRLNSGLRFQPAARRSTLGRGRWAPSSPPRRAFGDEQRPLIITKG